MRASTPAVSMFTRAREWLRRAVEGVRAWRWGAVFARALLGTLGLVVLGAIGQSAFARSVLSAGPPATPDAGPPPVTAPPVVAVPPASLPTAPPVQTSTVGAAGPGGGGSPLDPSRAHATPADPVYLNTATASELHRLPGVGPKRAEAILALRARLGHFRQIEDLLKVKGVGRSSLKKLRPLVRLDPPPAAVSPLDGGVADGRTA